MPSLFQFLLAPWKVFALLFGGPASTLPAAGAVATGATGATAMAPVAHTGLCYMRDLGGGSLASVCSVGGYEMPGFIFWASLLIFLLFIGASSMLIRQAFAVAGALERLTVFVAALPKKDPGAPVSDKELEQLRDAMAKEPVAEGPWNRFEGTLVSDPDGDGRCTGQPLEQALSREGFLEGQVNTPLYSAIPGVLTGVGLLMTFVAILDGLSKVTVSANMDVQGIGGLINGLSGKFVSSIVAVSCAVLFVFVERAAYGRAEGAHRKLIDRLGARIPRRTAEQWLAAIHAELSGRKRSRS